MYIDLKEISEITKIHHSRLVGVYVFGSTVYGTNNYNSDIDLVVIGKSLKNNYEIKHEHYNIHIQTPDQFQEDLKNNLVRPIECVLSDKRFKILDPNYELTLYKDRLIHNFINTSKNAWEKGRYKLNNGEIFLGLKNLFHSLRISNFGLQVLREGKINYQSCNELWLEIKEHNSYEEINKNFHSILKENIKKLNNEHKTITSV